MAECFAITAHNTFIICFNEVRSAKPHSTFSWAHSRIRGRLQVERLCVEPEVKGVRTVPRGACVILIRIFAAWHLDFSLTASLSLFILFTPWSQCLTISVKWFHKFKFIWIYEIYIWIYELIWHMSSQKLFYLWKIVKLSFSWGWEDGQRLWTKSDPVTKVQYSKEEHFTGSRLEPFSLFSSQNQRQSQYRH